MGKYLEKKQKKWFRLLVLALIAYTVKNIFVGVDVDEGYGIMVGYRLIRGDRLLLEMWEPHQTSGIFTAFFMAPFLWITAGELNFLNICLRVAFFAVHGFLAYRIYRTIVVCIPRVGNVMAALMAVFFYVTSPKCIYIPEYSNLQVWFTAATIMCLMWYFSEASPKKGNVSLLVLGGVFLACDVLAYPSMALLFPVCVGYMLWRGCGKKCVFFAIPCAAGALLFIGYLLSYMSFSQIAEVLPHILGEGSHKMEWEDKLGIWLKDLETILAFAVVGGMLAAAMTVVQCAVVKRRGYRTVPRVNFLFRFFAFQTFFQIGYWILGNDAIAYMQLNYLFMSLLGIYCYYKAGKRDKDGIGMIVIALCGYLAVALLSNWGPNNLNPYLVMGVLGGFLCLDVLLEKELAEYGRKWTQKLLFLFILANVFGYSYRMIGGDSMNSTVLEVRSYNRTGVRAGILTDYMTSYMYNTNQEIWAEAVPDGSTLFYVGSAQFSYMHGDCTVAVPSTISTPTYDETLLAYWEMNPDRYPNVVAIESSYGDIGSVAHEEFLMQWLEEEFRATEIIDYPYVRVYRR